MAHEKEKNKTSTKKRKNKKKRNKYNKKQKETKKMFQLKFIICNCFDKASIFLIVKNNVFNQLRLNML